MYAVEEGPGLRRSIRATKSPGRYIGKAEVFLRLELISCKEAKSKLIIRSVTTA